MDLRAEAITKRFGPYAALDGVSFDARPGELVALLGPSGSGKSTLLRIVAGLDRHDGGRLFLGGERADHLPPQARGVGFVFQHYALFRHLTVEGNIGFGLDVLGVPRPERRARIDELLLRTGLNGFERRYPAQLSGGQRQRVALARALAPRPRLLLLDEPFSALDARLRDECRTWLRALHEEEGVTSIFVTHDQDEAFALADRVALLNLGRLEQFGTPGEILDAPASEFVARFVGNVNVLEGRAEAGRLWVGKLPLGHPSPLEEGPVRVVVRYQDATFHRADDGVAVVDRVVPLGDRVRVDASIEGAGSIRALLPHPQVTLSCLAPGTRIRVEILRARAYA